MFTLRTATTQDIPAVDALLTRAYPRLLKPDYPAEVLDAALPAISHAQPDLVQSGTYYLVEEEGRLLGAGGWTPEAPGKGQITHGVGHIRHVVTDDRATRRGVGRALLEHVIASTQSKGLKRLDCLSTLTAVPFYKAVGFEPYGTLNEPLANGASFPAVQMTRAL